VNTLVRSMGGSFGPSVGSCAAYEVAGSSLVLTDPATPQYLNAGSQLTVTGPNGTKTASATSTGVFDTALASSAPFYLAPGNYTVQNGAGGSNVPAFTWSMTLPSNVVPTNLPSKVNRSQDLTLTWSGGAGFNVVTIFGYTGVPVTAGQLSYVEFICNADASAGQFTIPSSILMLLPTNGFGRSGVAGVNLQLGGVPLIRSTVAGSPGLDAGVLSGFITTGAVATVQ